MWADTMFRCSFFKNYKHLSLKYKFLIVFLLVITLPTMLIGSYIYYETDLVFKKQALESTQDVLDKIENNLISIVREVENISAYAIFNDDIRKYMFASTVQLNERDMVQSTANINGFLLFQLQSKEYITSIELESVNGHSMYAGEPVNGDEERWNAVAVEQKGDTVWSDAYPLQSAWSGKSKEVISLSRVINDYNDIRKQIGLVRIRLDVQKLNKLVEIPNLRTHGAVYLTNEHNQAILNFGNNGPELGKLLEGIDNADRSSSQYSIDDKNYLVVKRPITDVNWNLIAVVNEKSVANQLAKISSLIRNMVIILTILGLVVLFGFYYSLVRRIIDLTRKTERMVKRDFSIRVHVTAMDEIGKLGTRFNQMVETIRNYIEIEYKLKIKQKEFEMKVLSSQIDPHFLYNTLDMIRWKARLENAEETSRLIEQLSRIFRVNLQRKIWISVGDEILFLSSYLDLQQKRIGSTLQYHIFYDCTIESLTLMKQTIQILVENAIVHGFKMQRTCKTICVRCYEENSMLIIDVIDNGCGLTIEQFNHSIYENEGHALKNLQDRLVLAFGNSYGLRWNEPGESGTWITICLPIIPKDINVESLYQPLGESHDEKDTIGR